jgi:large subunit ribosomal protein L5
MPRLKDMYNNEVAPAMMQKFQYKSVMQIPKIDKIVVSVGCGDCKDNTQALDAVIKDISALTGQKAVATTARKSVANFKLREGMKVGVKVTLRHDRMWEFLDRLLNVALPVSATSAVSRRMPLTAAATTASASKSRSSSRKSITTRSKNSAE